MKDTGKNVLRMVKTNWDEIERKVQEHRLKQIRTVAIIVGVCVALGIAYYVYMQQKMYDSYTVREQVKRSDTAATHFLEYNGNILKYSNDGASYTDKNNRAIWNQSYEMQNPMVSICERYVAIADRQGKEIFILNTSGLQGQIDVTMPVSKIETAAQGTVAVLTAEDAISYLSLYDKTGELLAEGAIYMENSGMPLDIAISPDGTRLAVAILDIMEGTAKTTINFYDFSSVGQKQIDNIVASYSYPDCVIPDIAYVDGNGMAAFGDNAVYTFTGDSVPKEDSRLTVSEEIQSIFYDNEYFGLVFADSADGIKRNIRIYDMDCATIASIPTNISYNHIRFLDNHEICLFNETQCEIYTLGGREKFRYEFEKTIGEIIHTGGYRGYLLLLEGETDQVMLKLFGSSEEEPAEQKPSEDQQNENTEDEAGGR